MIKEAGFVGLGVMGKPMAENLLKAGYSLTIYDLNQEVLKDLESKGAIVAVDPAQVAADSKVVFTMLPNNAIIKEVYLGPKGLASQASPGSIFIDSSTVDPVITREIGAHLKEKKAYMLDAPVGGGPSNAVNGDLIMLVGGEAEVLESCRDELMTVGGSIIHTGPLGMGVSLKLSNNLLTGIFGCLLVEAFNFAENIGVDSNDFLSLLKKNMPNQLNRFAEKIINQDLEPGFLTKLMHKDLKIIQGLAQDNQVAIPLGATVKELYQHAINNGCGDLDFLSVSSFYRKL